MERTIKEVVHEAGHAFGLIHCPDYNCVMHAATYVDADRSPSASVPRASLCWGREQQARSPG